MTVPLRARARAMGLKILIVLDGYRLGPTGGPFEHLNTVEALTARLDEIERSQLRPDDAVDSASI